MAESTRRTFLQAATAAGSLLLLPAHKWPQNAEPAVLEAREGKATLLLLPAKKLVFGRGKGSAVQLTVSRAGKRAIRDDARISRRHFEVALTSKRVTLTDLGSSNGTTVAGKRVRGSVALKNGARIVVAGKLTLRAQILRNGKAISGVVLTKTNGDPVRYAMIAGAVGVSLTKADVLVPAGGGLRISNATGPLQLHTGNVQVQRNGKAVARHTSFAIGGRNQLQLGSTRMNLLELGKSPLGKKLMAPKSVAHTFCGTPEY